MPENKLVVGKMFLFKVLKHFVDLDNSGWYVLVDPFGCKHLLTDLYYASYKIQAGDEILCNVDKVNCKGKIFLEPEHPNYKPGQIAEFTFVEFSSIFNKKRKKQIPVAVFTDDKGNSALCMQQQIFPKTKMQFRILRVKKAIIYIEVI